MYVEGAWEKKVHSVCFSGIDFIEVLKQTLKKELSMMPNRRRNTERIPHRSSR